MVAFTLYEDLSCWLSLYRVGATIAVALATAPYLIV